MSSELFHLVPLAETNRAELIVRPAVRGKQRVNPHLLGKFCEHLGRNIYQGMEAQILDNPTFGKWPFSNGECRINGGVRGQGNPVEVLRQIRAAVPTGHDAEAVVQSYTDGMAYGWLRLGEQARVRVSQDVAQHGGRAQRVEVLTPGDEPAGCWQPLWLPLHRTRGYEVRLTARSSEPAALTALVADAHGKILAHAVFQVGDAWQTFSARLELPSTADANAEYRFELRANGPSNIVFSRCLLYPNDHVHGADPDIIRMFREVKLPLLRWPGGNFSSGYHWQDGIGPQDLRPTLPNPAWAGLEYNFFGTDEFMAFCKAVGCEPFICVNAGNGTPDEAAAWVEYCNGAATTPMGRLRASNGHPAPYGIKLWEIGNELWGKWQVGWTTPGGYADRYRRFAAAMRAADPTITLIANGPQCVMDQEWTHRLIDRGGPQPNALTDHLLNWYEVSAADDPWDIFQTDMAYPVSAGREYRWLHKQMLAEGIRDPWIALTEMIVYPKWTFKDGEVEGTMIHEECIKPDTLAEACSFACFLCECIRLEGFVRMITHTASVNHGGGLRKEHERIYANPVHYVHAMAATLAGATPVGVEMHCATYATQKPHGFVHVLKDVPVLDAVAVERDDGHLAILIAQRSRQAVHLALRVEGKNARKTVSVTTLEGTAPWEGNTLEAPTRVAPVKRQVPVVDGRIELDLTPSGVMLVEL